MTRHGLTMLLATGTILLAGSFGTRVSFDRAMAKGHPEESAMAAPTVVAPTAEPPPSGLIWQPPTRTPRPNLTAGGSPASVSPFRAEESPFEPQRLRQAAWDGVALSLGAFALIATHGLIRAARRGELRGWWREFRREALNPILNRQNKPSEPHRHHD